MQTTKGIISAETMATAKRWGISAIWLHDLETRAAQITEKPFVPTLEPVLVSKEDDNGEEVLVGAGAD